MAATLLRKYVADKETMLRLLFSKQATYKQHYLLAYGFPQFTVESTEPIDTIAVVFFKTGLHKLQELRLLCVVYCEKGKKSSYIQGEKKPNTTNILIYFHNSR